MLHVKRRENEPEHAHAPYTFPYLICHEPLQSLGNREKKEGEEKRSVKYQGPSQTSERWKGEKKKKINRKALSYLPHINRFLHRLWEGAREVITTWWGVGSRELNRF